MIGGERVLEDLVESNDTVLGRPCSFSLELSRVNVCLESSSTCIAVVRCAVSVPTTDYRVSTC